MLTGKARTLTYPLDRSIVLENEVPAEDVGGRPAFPEDPDVKIVVPIELSANEFTYLASTVDVGRDPAYPDQSQYIWWLWNRIFLTMTICEAMAQCLIDQNEALINALADALVNNETLRNALSDALEENGGATPGMPLSDSAAERDTLPDNVRDAEGNCIPNKLWGGTLYLVQSGDRAIKDFFEILQAAVEVIEASAILVQNIPAIGGYAASTAAFAAKLQTVVAAGYNAAYTQEYEEALSCALFCIALDDCHLSVDMIINTLNNRLTAPMDLADMGEFMANVIAGTFIGDEIADVAFLLYFTALKFGQQFADKLGIRPLTDLMELGAAQLASDNWSILCDCEGIWVEEVDFTGVSMPAGWTVTGGSHSVGNGVSVTADQGGGLFYGRVSFDPGAGFHVNSFRVMFSPALADSYAQIFSPSDGSSYEWNFNELAGGEEFQDGLGLPDDFSSDAFITGVAGASANTMYVTGVRITGSGFNPFA